MKILFLANRLPHAHVAGGHRLIYQRMRMLTQRGHQVGLAAFSAPNERKYVDGLRKELFEVNTVTLPKRRAAIRLLFDYTSQSLPAIFWKNYSKEMMQTTGDMVGQSKYDIVLAEFSEMGMYLYRNPYLSAVHKVVSSHRCLSATFEQYAKMHGVQMSLRLKSASQLHMLERFEFEMYSAMDHILTLTTEDRFTLSNYAPQLPVSVIPPGIDFNYITRKKIKPTADPIIMMCGYFANKSNHDAAMWFTEQIWPTLSQQHPTLRCLLVGAGASMEMKRSANRKERLLVAGAVDDLRPYREQATIFINPMRLGSGLRIKLLEAMATGLPVVTTTLGAAGIPAQNGVNCFIADTPKLFIDSINWLLKDPKLTAEMGLRARELILQKYDVQTTIPELEKVLTEVISF